MEIKEEYNGIRVGDLITTYTKGFRELTAIEVRRISTIASNGLTPVNCNNYEAGNEIEPYFRYKKICDSKGKITKKQENDYCVASCCKPAKLEVEKLQEELTKLEAVLNNWRKK